MAQGLYSRVNSRGYPSSVYAGMTGAGALESQGGPYDPAHGDTTDVAQYGNQVLTGYDPEGPADPAVPILEGMWGLAGDTAGVAHSPGGHAAPVADWVGQYDGHEIAAYGEQAMEIHSVDFGTLPNHTQVIDVASTPMTDWSTTDTGETAAQQLAGQIRYMGGFDAVQGYGGGGSGPGGINPDAAARNRTPILNEPQPMVYLDPAERPALWPQAAGNFTPSDAVQGPGPWASGWDAGSVPYDDPSAYEPPPDPDTLGTPLAAASVSSGWW